jgi:quinol-cytochrome oxidoreductase complex cytochrome b subunit
MSTPRRGSKGLPIGPGHVLYPMLALLALSGLLFGSVGHQVTEDMPESEAHPYYPDHFWPYPILAMAVLAILGLLAVVGQQVLQLAVAADPRLAVIPRPEWYFLFLFQFVKLGPALVTSIVLPTVVVIGLVFWPLLDARLGPKMARRLGWRSWPVPKRNVVTGTLWLAGLSVIGLLTLWAALWPSLCIPWFYNGPVCGG